MTVQDKSGKNRRILAVDDSEQLLEMYQKLFTSVSGSEEESRDAYKSVSALEQILRGETLAPQRVPKGNLTTTTEGAEICLRQPFDLTCCTQGLDAVEAVHKAALEGQHYAVALVDMRMPPGIDGMDTALRIRTIDTEVQIVFITANSDYNTDEVCSRVGGQVLFFRKPFQNEELYQTVRNCCWSWNQGSELRGLQQTLESRIDLQTRRLQERVHSMELLQKNTVHREQQMGVLKRENRFLRGYQDLRLLLSSDPLPQPQPLKMLQESDEGPLQLLLVDDEDIIRLLLTRQMEAIGFHVSVAENVTEGMNQALQTPPDIALIDYQMKGGNGDILIKRMWEDPRTSHTLTILFTGMGDEALAIDAGAVYWMHKQQEPELLQQKMALVRDYVLQQHDEVNREEQDALLLLKELPHNVENRLENNRILLVDDLQDNLDVLERLLSPELSDDELELELHDLVSSNSSERGEGAAPSRLFEVTSLTQGQDAVNAAIKMQLAGTPFAVALVDMRMPPGIDELETAKQLRQVSPFIEIIILTAYSDYSLENIRQVLGANFTFLGKPYTSDEVFQRVIEGCARWGSSKKMHGAHTALLNLAEDMQQEIVRRKETEKELESANEAKDSFFSSMSHELRTPLTTIIGYNELILEELTLPDKYQNMLENILLAGKTLLQLVNDILDMSKIRVGKFELHDQPFDLYKVVNEISELMQVNALSKGCTLQLEVSEVVQPQLKKQWIGDEMRISQILFNLLSNAIKFSDGNKVVLRLGISSISSISVSGFYNFELQVQDFGVGISSEVQARLFTPFEQAASTTSSRFGGTGLGLYIAHQLVEMMGGNVQVESQERVGSTFTVHLPLKSTDLDVEVKSSPSQRGKNSVPQLEGTVLMAEDTIQLQRLQKLLVEKTGVRVETVNNGVEALKLGKSGHYQLILMDMQMPKMDGIEATRRLREAKCNTPIVALTANVMQRDRELFEAAGCDGFLSKPISRMRLYDVLEKYLDSASEPLLSSESQQTVVAEVVKRVDEGESGEESDDLSDMIDDEMWQDFWDYLKEAQQQLEQAWEAGDWEQIRSVAHAIKGMGSSYGEQEMTAVATHLQDHALSGKDASSPHYEKLLELLKRNDQ